VTEDEGERPVEANGGQKALPEVSAGYDSYRSLANPNIIIIVPKHAIPPFRFKAGGWELWQSSIELDSAAKERIAEEGFLMDPANLDGPSELISSDHERPLPVPSLEIEFALVISGMIESVKNNPRDIRQIIFDLARYKLQEQLLDANAEEIERTQQALEAAIRGVEAFSQKRVQILSQEMQSHGDAIASVDRKPAFPEVVPQIGPRVALEPQRSAIAVQKNGWPHLRRAAATMIILAAIALAIQLRGDLTDLAYKFFKFDLKTAVEDRSAPPPSGLPPAKSAVLRPTDYGTYAIGNGVLFDLTSLPGRAPDIRFAVSPPLAMPSRTILPNGHPRFIVFSRDLVSILADRAEVRIIAKIAREFSAKASNGKPVDDAWVIRNISFPFRSSPVIDNPEMSELHSDDPGLELPPGRYALILKSQAYDFSVEGNAVDPRQCVERIIGSTGIFYSECKDL